MTTKAFSNWIESVEGLETQAYVQDSPFQSEEWKLAHVKKQSERKKCFEDAKKMAENLGCLPISPEYKSLINEYMLENCHLPYGWRYEAFCSQCGMILVDFEDRGKAFSSSGCPWIPWPHKSSLK